MLVLESPSGFCKQAAPVTKRSPSTSWSSANGRTQPAGRRRCLFSVGRDRPSTVPGLLPLPISSLKSRVSCIRQPGQPQPGTPARCFDQFRYAFADAVSEDEGKQLYETYVVPTPGKPLFQAATANQNPWTEAKVDTDNPERASCSSSQGRKTIPCRRPSPTPPTSSRTTRRHRDHRDQEPWTCPHHPQLARSRRHRPCLRQRFT
jgi:hypothetical protein